MAGTWRNLSRNLRDLVAKGRQYQQKRLSGTGPHSDTDAYFEGRPLDKSALWLPKNPYVEAWNWRRENFEYEFQWTPKNIRLAIWMFGVMPVVMYDCFVKGMWAADDFDDIDRRAFAFKNPGPHYVEWGTSVNNRPSGLFPNQYKRRDDQALIREEDYAKVNEYISSGEFDKDVAALKANGGDINSLRSKLISVA